MGINSTEVAYNFGQLGSMYTAASNAAISPPTNKVFIAITMITDTTFDASAGLIADNDSAGAGLEYIGTDTAAHNLSDGSETTSSGSEGLVVDSVIFPAGVTIYGRWTEIDIDTGSCVAYIGD
jgi:hypothetical protein|tara:strand:- start:151 stop:519 length:369 start_codon:yes stop_codon:yes gene_type:complete